MAFSRTTKLGLLGCAAAGLVGVLWLSIQESQTIVVEATPSAPTLAMPTSATAISELAAPRYTGRNGQGAWELTATRASQFAAAVQQDENTTRSALGGEIALNTVAARFEPDNAPPLALQATTATYTPSITLLNLPQGVAATGVVGPYAVQLFANGGTVNLSTTTLNLTGGVSATLTPR